MASKFSVGIDIGTDQIKVVVAENVKSEEGVELLKLSASARQNRVV